MMQREAIGISPVLKHKTAHLQFGAVAGAFACCPSMGEAVLAPTLVVLVWFRFRNPAEGWGPRPKPSLGEWRPEYEFKRRWGCLVRQRAQPQPRALAAPANCHSSSITRGNNIIDKGRIHGDVSGYKGYTAGASGWTIRDHEKRRWQDPEVLCDSSNTKRSREYHLSLSLFYSNSLSLSHFCSLSFLRTQRPAWSFLLPGQLVFGSDDNLVQTKIALWQSAFTLSPTATAGAKGQFCVWGGPRRFQRIVSG